MGGGVTSNIICLIVCIHKIKTIKLSPNKQKINILDTIIHTGFFICWNLILFLSTPTLQPQILYFPKQHLFHNTTLKICCQDNNMSFNRRYNGNHDIEINGQHDASNRWSHMNQHEEQHKHYPLSSIPLQNQAPQYYHMHHHRQHQQHVFEQPHTFNTMFQQVMLYIHFIPYYGTIKALMYGLFFYIVQTPLEMFYFDVWWGSKPPEDICYGLTGHILPPSFWVLTPDRMNECYGMLDRQYMRFLQIFMLVVLLLVYISTVIYLYRNLFGLVRIVLTVLWRGLCCLFRTMCFLGGFQTWYNRRFTDRNKHQKQTTTNNTPKQGSPVSQSHTSPNKEKNVTRVEKNNTCFETTFHDMISTQSSQSSCVGITHTDICDCFVIGTPKDIPTVLNNSNTTNTQISWHNKQQPPQRRHSYNSPSTTSSNTPTPLGHFNNMSVHVSVSMSDDESVYHYNNGSRELYNDDDVVFTPQNTQSRFSFWKHFGHVYTQPTEHKHFASQNCYESESDIPYKPIV